MQYTFGSSKLCRDCIAISIEMVLSWSRTRREVSGAAPLREARGAVHASASFAKLPLFIVAAEEGPPLANRLYSSLGELLCCKAEKTKRWHSWAQTSRRERQTASSGGLCQTKLARGGRGTLLIPKKNNNIKRTKQYDRRTLSAYPASLKYLLKTNIFFF